MSGEIYWDLYGKGTTLYAEVHSNQLEKLADAASTKMNNPKKVVLQNENVRPHIY